MSKPCLGGGDWSSAVWSFDELSVAFLEFPGIYWQLVVAELSAPLVDAVQLTWTKLNIGDVDEGRRGSDA